MLSPGEIAQIRAEIERLERLRKECTEGGIRKRIEAWIEAENKKLASSDNPKVAPRQVEGAETEWSVRNSAQTVVCPKR